MFKITNIQATRTIGAVLILLSGNAFAGTPKHPPLLSYATQTALNAEVTARANADKAEVTSRNAAIRVETTRAMAAEAAGAGTKIADGTHKGDILEWDGSAWTPVTIPSYSAPVVVDANGVYIGTFLQEAGDSSVYTQFTEQNPCWNSQTGALNCNQELYTLIFPTGYQIKLSDNRGEITSFHQTTGYENSTCSGSATLVGNSNLINPIKNLVFKVISYDLRRINQDILESGDYYFPSTPVPYTGPSYMLYHNSTFSCIPVGDPQKDSNTAYYKPLINDPSVTGYDPAIINALQKPFRVSID